MPVPAPTPVFALYTVTGATAQIVATFLLIHLFSYRNFAVGTTYSKTETVQTAVFGILILGDRVHPRSSHPNRRRSAANVMRVRQYFSEVARSVRKKALVSVRGW